LEIAELNQCDFAANFAKDMIANIPILAVAFLNSGCVDITYIRAGVTRANN
jgi:hypothetical protein